MSLFVTGAPRSGTTLLDKVLSMQADAVVLSQPLPLVYVRVKEVFLGTSSRIGAETAYPLNDLYGDNYRPPSAFLSFLHDWRGDKSFYEDVLERMVDFDGQYTKPDDLQFATRDFRGGSLAEFVVGYCRSVAPSSRLLVGWKETFCEEYIRYFLETESAVLQIVRDPRDVLASLSYGHNRRNSGLRKPHLFNIRQWRKSVAFAFEHIGRDGYQMTRYEDLVSRPLETLFKLTSALGIDPAAIEDVEGPLRDQNGEIWLSNSSHASVSRIHANSVGVHSSVLPKTVQRLIEATCFYEMHALGYEPQITDTEVAAVLEGYVDEQPLEREALRHYLWSRSHMEEEQARAQAICARCYSANRFIFERAFASLTGQAGAQ